VNVQMTANVFALRKILHAIENHTPLSFRGQPARAFAGSRQLQARPRRRAEMFVQFDVYGYALPSS
jgi:hypothetical protein